MPRRADQLLGGELPRGFRALKLGCFLLILLLSPLVVLLPGAAVAAEAGYLIGVGDSLQITVWRQNELSTSTTVRPDGRITIPLIEDLMAAGKEPKALAREIEGKLSEFVLDPQVTVALAGGVGALSQRIRIVGEAVTPRELPYRAGMTLLDAMISIGGLTPEADGNGATLIRHTGAGQEEIPLRLDDLVAGDDLRANMRLQPGDAIVIPEGFFSGGWEVGYSLNASESFSDNIDLDREGDETMGLVSRTGFGININGNAARINGALDANLAGVHQLGGDDEGFSLDPQVSGASTTELYRDHVFFDVNAAISRQVLNSRTSTSGSGASTSGTETVISFSASPSLVHRLGRFADVEWRYRITPVLVSSGETSDVLDHQATVAISSGSDFSRFGWSLSGRRGQQVRKGEKDINTENADLDLTIPVWDSFALIGGVGYETRDGDSEDFSGFNWRGGFRWTPSPDTSVEATYGRRDNSDDLNARVDYRIGPKTNFNGSYTETLTTSQERVANILGQIGVDPETGQLINVNTNQPFDPNQGPFTFSDETTRNRTLQATVSHQSGRNNISFSGLAGKQTGSSDEDFFNAQVSWNRPLTTALSANTNVSYNRSEFTDDNRTDNTYGAGASLSYRMSSNVSSNLSYNFQKRQATEGSDSFIENSVTVGATINF